MAYAIHTFQSAVTATGNGTALTISTSSPQSVLTIQVDGITTATITPEVSVDGGTTWDNAYVVPLNSATPAATITADGVYRLQLPPNWFSDIRMRISAWTSGTITVKGRHGP